MTLPKTITFEGIRGTGVNLTGAPMFYERIAYRAPRKGEWYLSGAIIQAYRAPNDLTASYWVVRPTHHVDVSMITKRDAPYA